MASTESHTHDDARIATTEDTYRARRRTTERNRVVSPDGRRLDPRTDLANHSPTGLEWGYGGSGPAQLALALLADRFDDAVALDHHLDFKTDIVADIEGDEWVLPVRIVDEYLTAEQVDDATPSTEISGPHDERIDGELTGETFYRCEGCGRESLSTELKYRGCPRCETR